MKLDRLEREELAHAKRRLLESANTLNSLETLELDRKEYMAAWFADALCDAKVAIAQIERVRDAFYSRAEAVK